MKRIMLTFSVIFYLTMIIGCATLESKFNMAKKEDTISAYEKFLDELPEGELEKKARLRLEELYFGKVKSENTISSYARFLREFSDGKFINEIQSRLKSLYLKAESDGNIKNILSSQKFLFERIIAGQGQSSSNKSIILKIKKKSTYHVSTKTQNSSASGLQEAGFVFSGDIDYIATKSFIVAETTTATIPIMIDGRIIECNAEGEIPLDEHLRPEVNPSIQHLAHWEGEKDGSTHIIVGRIRIFSYEFDSDTNEPLTFKITKNGYFYLNGKGVVYDSETNKLFKFGQ